MDNHITQKKALQQQSAHFVKNGCEQTHGAVPNLLNDLDWPSLQHGRKNINFFILPFCQYKINDFTMITILIIIKCIKRELAS